MKAGIKTEKAAKDTAAKMMDTSEA